MSRWAALGLAGVGAGALACGGVGGGGGTGVGGHAASELQRARDAAVATPGDFAGQEAAIEAVLGPADDVTQDDYTWYGRGEGADGAGSSCSAACCALVLTTTGNLTWPQPAGKKHCGP